MYCTHTRAHTHKHMVLCVRVSMRGVFAHTITLVYLTLSTDPYLLLHSCLFFSLVSRRCPFSLSLSLSLSFHPSLPLSISLSVSLTLTLSSSSTTTHRTHLHKQNLRGDHHKLCRVAQPHQPHRKHPAIRRQELAGGGSRGAGAVGDHDHRAGCPQAAGLAVSAVVQWARAEAAPGRPAGVSHMTGPVVPPHARTRVSFPPHLFRWVRLTHSLSRSLSLWLSDIRNR